MVTMLGVLPFLILALGALGNPIKHTREQLSGTKGLTQQDYLVTKLPGMTENIPEPEIPLMFAGQLPLYESNNTHYFFWKFIDRQKEPRAENRTIFWLNGGPGCLLMDGALMEAGPFRVNGDNKITYNEGSWHRKGDIVFVDQPAGTGFSYSEEFDAELAEVLWHFLTFLDRYFALFPEDLGNEILLAGESYAGQYIPYIARAILDRNARIDADTSLDAAKYNLRGLLIGNGYIAPNEQGLSYIPFAIDNGLITKDHPRFSDLLAEHENCQSAIDGTKIGLDPSAYAIVDRTCDRVLMLLLQITVDNRAPLDQQCTNMYDYTLKDSYPSCGMNWPPDLKHVTPFLAKEAVMGDLNLVFHKHWTECSGQVGSHLKAKKSKPLITLFPQLLEEVEIVLFHGNRDIICNYKGAEEMILRLEWNGHRGFSDNAITYDWRHNGSVEGYLRSEGNLTYVNVFNASHMVPFDKPEVSRSIVDLLYRDYDLETEEQGKSLILTYPIGFSKDSQSNATAASSEGHGNLTATADDHTSRAVRVIQLAVICVLIWGVCALYTTYRSKPTSIIKTKPAGRKKNVLWADELEDAIKEPSLGKAPSLITKAFSKLTKLEPQGTYQRVDPEGIEMSEGVQSGDDFIIASEDEAEGDAENGTESDSKRSHDSKPSRD